MLLPYLPDRVFASCSSMTATLAYTRSRPSRTALTDLHAMPPKMISPRSMRAASLTLLAAFAASCLKAETYYWDINGSADNTTAALTGAWNGTNAFWNTDSTGGAGGTVTASTTNADDLVLSSGSIYTTGTITASGSRAASSVTFEDNVATTLAGPLTIGGSGAKSGIFVASGANANSSVTGLLTLNGATTFQKEGTGTLTIGATALAPSINGTGNLVLKNNSNTGAISLASTTAGAFNFSGSITNSGTGTAGVNIGGGSIGTALIGANVTSITQNSATSILTVYGGNTAFVGGVTVLTGTANLVNSNVSGGALGSITLGDTTGSADASVYIGSGSTNATPITVRAGSSGVKTLGGVISGAGGTTMTYSGSLTINDNVRIYQNSVNAQFGVLLSGSTISIASGKTMSLQNVVSTTSQLRVTGKITGQGGVTHTQGGATLSNAANDYTGPTSVTGGNLVLASGGSLSGTSGISVSTGATFTNNSGSVLTKPFTLAEGAILAGSAGFTASGLTVTADLADNFTSIAAGSLFTKGGTLTINLTNVADGTYTLFAAPTAGAFSGVSIGASALAGSGVFAGTVGGFDYTFTDSTGQLVIAAIPEPAAGALLAGLFGLAAAARRRSKPNWRHLIPIANRN